MSMSLLKKMGGAGVVLIMLTVVLLLGSASSPTPTPAPWPTLSAAVAPNPTEVAAIKALVDRYYDVTGEAAGTFDVSQFPTLFVDDPAVSLDSNQTAFIARLGAQGSGFLSFEFAYFGNWKQGAEKWEKLQAQAKAQGRQLTAAEVQSLNGPNGLPPSRRQEPVHKTNVTYLNFTIDGTRALVEFDDVAVTQNMFFIKTIDGWRIAGKRVLEVHV